MSAHLLQEKLDRYLVYLEQDTNNPHLLLTTGLLKAEILHHTHHLSEAIELLEALLLDYQSCAEITGLLSLLYFDNQNTVKAESYSKQTLLIDPTNYEAKLVRLLLQTLENNASADEINALIQKEPLDSRLWFILGSTQMRDMNIAAAEHAFMQATTIAPNFYDSWICSGWCYLLQNNLDKATHAYQQARHLDSEAAEGWGGSAIIHALQHQMPEAQRDLEKTESLDSTCFLAKITRLIMANHSSQEAAAAQFHLTFPDIASEMATAKES